MDKKQAYSAAVELMQSPFIRDREFYPEFRTRWIAAFDMALEAEPYFPPDSTDLCAVETECMGISYAYHLSRYKMAEWYAKELPRRKKVVFQAKRFRRDWHGNITYQDVPCYFDAEADEAMLNEKDRNIFACTFPSDTPMLRIVYGNRWLKEKFNPFLQRSLSLFLIGTDYVPAFLADPFELCLYLYLMDCSILKEDSVKVKDKDLKGLLHIFRPSPMLLVKGFMKLEKK